MTYYYSARSDTYQPISDIRHAIDIWGFCYGGTWELYEELARRAGDDLWYRTNISDTFLPVIDLFVDDVFLTSFEVSPRRVITFDVKEIKERK